ncbi:MAG TPA: ATP-binding cassette domain-containing protein, partial [Candidatus Limnocylindria bacterium]
VVVRTPPLRVERGARIAVVGANGAGKTTLVRTRVGQLPALDGYVSSAPTARVAFLAQAQAELTGDETVLDALRDATGLDEQSARDVLARFLFRGEDVFRSVGVLSGGERSRLALARLSAREANLLVLDEPTNHLDLAAREQLETVLAAFAGCLLFVSHDRYFIDKLAGEIWDIRDAALKRYEGGWTTFEKARDEGRPLPDPDTAALTSARLAQVSARPKPTKMLPKPVARPARTERPASATRRTASRVRKVEGVRALEARISAMELQLSQMARKLEDIAMSGDFMETRRLGSEHAELERSLRKLYEEWSAAAEPPEDA